MDSNRQEQLSVAKVQGKVRRRRYSLAEKLSIVRECLEPGASLAGVALAHSANANMVRKWVVKFNAGEFGNLSESGMDLLPMLVRKPEEAQAALTTSKFGRPKPTLEIELAHGVLRFYGPVESALLKTLVAALNRR